MDLITLAAEVTAEPGSKADIRFWLAIGCLVVGGLCIAGTIEAIRTNKGKTGWVLTLLITGACLIVIGIRMFGGKQLFGGS